VAPSTVTGAGAGLCLLAFGLATLLAGRHARSDPGLPAWVRPTDPLTPSLRHARSQAN